ncbi:MAG: GFA family protein [Rhodospirillaceae bacterium]|nr:GFA family protein [Rhodospirillaceae bacterium]
MRTGGCQCGDVRYAVRAAPRQLYACHCTECRRQSGSAFGLSLEVDRAAFALTRGRVATWTRPADGGGRVICHFCPRCGTRIWHEHDPASATLTVKAGTLDDPVDLSDAIHIWTDSRLPGVVIPDRARRYPGEPDGQQA